MEVTRPSTWFLAGRFISWRSKRMIHFHSISNHSLRRFSQLRQCHHSSSLQHPCMKSVASKSISVSVSVSENNRNWISQSNRKSFSSYPTQTDIDEVETSGSSISMASSDYTEIPSVMDREVDSDTEEHLSHLRTKIYPTSSDVDLDPQVSSTINQIYEAASVQEVLDIISNYPGVDLRCSSQALVTLWDLQKLLYQLDAEFRPEQDNLNRNEFVDSIKQSDVFQTKILRTVLDGHGKLEDEPLCASLLAMKKMNFPLEEYQPLIEECIRRKNSLCLSGLSRLSVCLRTENLYGQGIMGEFSPLILDYVKSMQDDLEIRLVSILLRNSNRIISKEMINVYVNKIKDILASDVELEVETVTYCKIFLVLLDCDKDKHCYDLIKEIGCILAERVPDMDLMELLSLQRFLHGSLQDPYPLVEALLARNLRVIEESKESPRLDLIAAAAPHMKDLQQKKQLVQMIKDYMNKDKFSSAQNVLFSIVRSLRTNDKSIYDMYWNRALQEIEDPVSTSSALNLRKVLLFARNYLNFCHGHALNYRQLWLERVIKKHFFWYLDQCVASKATKVVLNPSEFAVIVSYLTAFDRTFFDLKYLRKLENFASQFKAGDLYFIGKGVDCALQELDYNRRKIHKKSLDYLNNICSILEEECALRLLKNMEDVSAYELTMICRLITIIRKIKGDSPLMDISMAAFFAKPIHDSREVREISTVLSNGNFNIPKAMIATAEFVRKNVATISPETVEKVLNLTYSMGWESESENFGELAEKIETHWEKLGLGIISAGIALGFHRQLKPEFINKIFTVKFLDYIDEELGASYRNHKNYAMRIRMSLMELNRVACLDVPNAGLPWFHDKFCQSVVAQGTSKASSSYLHQEVQTALDNIFGSDGAVQSNVCSSKDYYYPIDFVLEFDEFDKPIRRLQRSKTFSFSRFKRDDTTVAKRKVAILALSNNAFTKHVRNLKGGVKLKQRHLEILGYQVINIDHVLWNSMYMSEHSVKEHYLESEIFSQCKVKS